MKLLSVLVAVVGMCFWSAGCGDTKSTAPSTTPDPAKMANEAKAKGAAVLEKTKESMEDGAAAVEEKMDEAADAVDDAVDDAADKLSDDQDEPGEDK